VKAAGRYEADVHRQLSQPLLPRRSLIVACCIVMIATAGCSRRANNKWVQRRPPTFRATGTVTCDGVAIDNALVSLDSLEHNLTAVGRTDTKGGFTLKTFEPGDGVTSGEHRVRITKIEVTAYDKDGTPLGHVNRLPERYASESGKLEATVEPKHGNVFRFDLTSGKPSAQ
jgi:hypothetical protein